MAKTELENWNIRKNAPLKKTEILVELCELESRDFVCGDLVEPCRRD